jgi:hypothetical protein
MHGMQNDTLPQAINPGTQGQQPGDKPAWHSHWHNLSKGQKAVAIGAGLILLVAISFGVYQLFHKPQKPQPTTSNVQAPAKPTTVASPLTGVQVAPELAKRPVTGIMIENSIYARPQSGIQAAGVVFEAIAEGGITRFLTLYQEAKPQYIGPVRSLRPYYIDWAGSFDASIAHIGGSPTALAQIRSHGKDLDEFFNAGSYWRQASRPAPHNVYTSFKLLDALNHKKGYTKSKFDVWPRKDDTKAAAPKIKSISLAISGGLYNVHYDYDSHTNSYLRSEGGRRHIVVTSPNDKKGKRLHPKVVIILIATYRQSGVYSVYGTSGKGTVYIFQDGRVTKGTWHKKDRAGQFKFTNAKGNDIKLNTGQAWVTALGARSQLKYGP